MDLLGRRRRYVHKLWQMDIGGDREDAQLQMVELLADAGLLVPKGVVLGTEAHREFLEQSGILEDLHAHPPPNNKASSVAGSGDEDAGSRAVWIRNSRRPTSVIEGELNRQICDALIRLGAPSVAVGSDGITKRHLKSIPDVKEAIKEAWLSLEGLKRQLEAVSRAEEIPTWPVLILAEGA